MVRLGVVLRAHPSDDRAPLASGAAKSPFRLLRYLSRRVDVAGVVVVDHAGRRSSLVAGHPVGWLRLYPRTLVWNLINAPAVLRLARRADVLQCHHPHFGLAAAAARRWGRHPFLFVVKAHGTAVPEAAANRRGRGWRPWILALNSWIHRWHDRWVLRAADVCVVSSSFQRSEMTKLYSVAPERVTTIYNGFDPEHRRVRSRSTGHGSRAPRLIFVGRVAAKKGFEHLALVYAQLRQRHPGVSLTLVLGASNAVEDVTTYRFVRDHLRTQPGCRVLHDLDESGLYGALADSDIGIVPSTGYESIPSVIYEMCATGLPTFATYRWGIPEVLPEEFGLSGDVETDVDRISHFIEKRLDGWDSDAWAQRYDRFSYEVLATEYEHLYKSTRAS